MKVKNTLIKIGDHLCGLVAGTGLILACTSPVLLEMLSSYLPRVIATAHYEGKEKVGNGLFGCISNVHTLVGYDTGRDKDGIIDEIYDRAPGNRGGPYTKVYHQGDPEFSSLLSILRDKPSAR